MSSPTTLSLASHSLSRPSAPHVKNFEELPTPATPATSSEWKEGNAVARVSISIGSASSRVTSTRLFSSVVTAKASNFVLRSMPVGVLPSSSCTWATVPSSMLYQATSPAVVATTRCRRVRLKPATSPSNAYGSTMPGNTSVLDLADVASRYSRRRPALVPITSAPFTVQQCAVTTSSSARATGNGTLRSFFAPNVSSSTKRFTWVCPTHATVWLFPGKKLSSSGESSSTAASATTRFRCQSHRVTRKSGIPLRAASRAPSRLKDRAAYSMACPRSRSSSSNARLG